ncbi:MULTISPECIES: HK97 family phage prohead protease [unclassified Flavonifractor]|uniref:HK97 family phage prohead protease n=1 Tax=unclassified Flavonifractor TaxID=2629267 RepID=UPI001FA90C9F|nr:MULTISPECIES: HK97 family phage prohead protease [unclassified Flavonifractor]
MPLMVPTAANKRFDTDYYVEGYATTFDDPYVLWEYDGVQYKEVIDRHALDGADLSDVIMQYDHGGRVFARTGKSNTLLIEPQEHGLFMAADLSKTEQARSMHEDIAAGLVTKMSWAFTVQEDSYDRDTHTRRILKIRKVYDVSAVSFPANPSTDISARSWLDGVIEAEKAERLAAQAAERRKQRLRVYLEVIRT